MTSLRDLSGLSKQLMARSKPIHAEEFQLLVACMHIYIHTYKYIYIYRYRERERERERGRERERQIDIDKEIDT